jgi:hypothetical protein
MNIKSRQDLRLTLVFMNVDPVKPPVAKLLQLKQQLKYSDIRDCNPHIHWIQPSRCSWLVFSLSSPSKSSPEIQKYAIVILRHISYRSSERGRTYRFESCSWAAEGRARRHLRKYAAWALRLKVVCVCIDVEDSPIWLSILDLYSRLQLKRVSKR